MRSERRYRDLRVWQCGMDLGSDVTRLVRQLERPDRWVFDTQIRKAAWSIPANIAEGHQRQHTREYLQHVYIGRGSLGEVDTFLSAIERTCAVDATLVSSCLRLGGEVGRLLNGLTAALREKVKADSLEGGF